MLAAQFGDFVAARMREEHRTLAARWLARLVDILPVGAKDVFPTESLLDHIPALIDTMSDYVRAPEADAIAANTSVIEKARELGALRHEQRASLHQVLREYQLLDTILTGFVLDEIERLAIPPPPAECVRIAARLNQAVSTLAQTTVESFVSHYTETIADQADRLEQFTRMAAHEWRQPVSALQVGVALLQRPDLDPDRTRRAIDAVARNVGHLVDLTRKLETVARVRDTDSPVLQELPVRNVAEEAARQLREMAAARGVDMIVVDRLPVATVDVGRLELTFVNLLSNAIKYSDPKKPSRFVAVEAAEPPDAQSIGIRVRDNGLGIAASELPKIFRRFTRAHDGLDNPLNISGVGLGLAIVDDCVRAMGGRIEVQSAEGEGTAFTLHLPLQHGGR